MPPESVSRLLDESAELKPLAARLAYIKRLQRRYRTLAPERLAQASRVCAIDGTTVVILAEGGAVAAALRQLAPRLLEGLRESARKSSRGGAPEITSIRVEVQVAVPVKKRPASPRTEMPGDKLAHVAERLSDSPLRDTIQRIVRDRNSKPRTKTS